MTAKTGTGAVFLAIALFVGAFVAFGLSGAWDTGPQRDAIQRLAMAYQVEMPTYR